MRIINARLILALPIIIGCSAETEMPRPPASTDSAVHTGSTLGSPLAPPVFEIGLAPGEGTPVIEAVAPELTLSACPRLDCPVAATVAADPGSRLDYDSTRYQTLAVARVTAQSSAEIPGRDIGVLSYLSREQYYSSAFPDTSVELEEGESFDFLQHRAEGTCFLRIRGRILDARSCPVHDSTRFRVSGSPDTKWWIHMRRENSAGGWLLLTDTTARVVGRTMGSEYFK